MRGGTRTCCVYNFDKEQVDFDGVFESPDFPSKEIFHFSNWRKNYKKYLKPTDYVDAAGKKTSEFPFDPNFTIVIVSKAKSEEELMENVGFVPYIDKFWKVVV